MSTDKEVRRDGYSEEEHSNESWEYGENMCCPMMYSCPYMMQGMYMNSGMMYQQMQQPMMGRGYDDQPDDEDMSRSRRPYYPYPYHTYYHPYYGHPYMHSPRPWMYK